MSGSALAATSRRDDSLGRYAGEPTISLAGREIPVVAPSWRDPRMHVAAVIFTLHAIGQIWLDFELSIAQVLICLLVGAGIDLGVTLVRDGALVWPGSGLLAANGVAFIFRVNGTEPGDWWSTNGWSLFAACAAVSVLSKYALVVGDRHLFNPSNFGLVLCFLVFGTERVNPLDFWWAPWSPAMALVYVVIGVGGLTLARRTGAVPVVATFWAVFAVGLAVVAVTGHSMSARWHVGPVTDWAFWWVVVTSPEVLVFLFFMITDPRTMPRGRVGRVLFAAIVGLASAALAAPQSTEFATKVAVLAGLLVGCAARPSIERLAPVAGSAEDDPRRWVMGILGVGAHGGDARRPRAGVTRVAALAAVVVVAGGLVGLGSFARDPLPSAGLVVDGDVVAGRPALVLAPEALPPVEVSEGAVNIQGALDDARAEEIVADVLIALEIERQALESRDLALASTALAGDRLAEVSQMLAAAVTGPPPVPPPVRPVAAEVVTVRDPTNPQAVPRLGVVITSERAERDGVSAETVVETHVVVEAGGHHLITEVIPGRVGG